MVTYRQGSQPGSCIRDSALADFGPSYFLISLSLDVLLTPMIIIQLVLHGRNICGVMGVSSGLTRLCGTVVAILIESSAIYAASSPSFLGCRGSRSYIADMFSAIHAETQVRALSLSTRAVFKRGCLM